ncbi:hypothetical protein HGI30_18920 [Paenibacillus albicereus]|uniref:FAD-binding PCMH-type domain-containing protein n=1 Tax=Paenibacillus albicereus TaxID=2726185 RepID=A0A6H2H173_9BACL|nr:FAD binding domain-containing protein [Paenibacillus albicereus]QJC53434.1 hypothetical protein HGI30_18920 [Paenibacillus albicereus]
MSLRETAGPLLLQPATLEEAWRLRARHGFAALPVAGGTLLRTQWENGVLAPPSVLLDLRRIRGLADIEHQPDGSLRIGSQATLSAVLKAPQSAGWPMLREALRTIAAPGVRNLGTLGGNIASAVGDSLPALLALDAELDWYDGASLAGQSVEAWLEQRRAGAAPERRLLAAVTLPAPAAAAGAVAPAAPKAEGAASLRGREGAWSEDGPSAGARSESVWSEAAPGEGARSEGGRWHAWRKVGRRESFTPALVCVAAAGGGPAASGAWLRLAAGGGSAPPQRLRLAERAALAALATSGDPARAASAAHEAALAEYTPAGDAFADAEYRRRCAANLAAAAVWEGWTARGGERP